MKARSMAVMDPDTEPLGGAQTAVRALKYVLALDEGAELLFFAGEPREAFSIGRTGTFHIDGSGVLDVHAFVHFDGQRLFMCSTDSVTPVLVDGAPLPRRWTELTPTCYLRFGAIAVALRGPDTARPSRIGEETTVFDFAQKRAPADKPPQSDHSLTRCVVEPTLVSARVSAPPSYSRPVQSQPSQPGPPSHLSQPTQATQPSAARREARRKWILAAVIFVTVSALAMTGVLLGRVWSQRHRKAHPPIKSLVNPSSTAPKPSAPAGPVPTVAPQSAAAPPATSPQSTTTPQSGTAPQSANAPQSATASPQPATAPQPANAPQAGTSPQPATAPQAGTSPQPATGTSPQSATASQSAPPPTGIIVYPSAPREVAPPTSAAAKTTTLERTAVDAFHSGDLPKALELYERLAAEQPGNPTFANAARILRQRIASSQAVKP
ncbi:hypothetical protein [Pendulispora albinea]|uniref:FHA domain-containing protein n=1 Tax=Pendulispora albinea TaxID=2741071 RepID=A0ABZ2LRG7_9BACT